MKKRIILVATVVSATFAQAQTSNQFWTPIKEAEIKPLGERVIIPQKYKTYHLVNNNLKTALWAAPNEKDVKLENSQVVVELPMPDGTMKKYRVVYSPVMAPELAAAFPTIKTFNIMGIDEPGVYGKVDWTEMGFHAMIRKVGTDVYIDPYCRTNYMDYISYNTSDYTKDPSKIQHCEGTVENPKGIKKKGSIKRTNSIGPCIGDSLQTYRLAVACTHEYAIAATGLGSPTVAQTLGCIVTTVNRVDGVYETEVACKMILVATETVVVYTNATTDPFTGNNNANTLINESQTIIDANIGDANYDVGHTFSTGGGGLSTLGGVCTTGQKASSITGSPTPTGDGYDIDYVAHEMGHDFGGDHTFRAVSGSCSGNENLGTMVEPGSGITIMAYAGICAPNDDSAHSIPYFHIISFDEITAYTLGGAGNSCPVIAANGNHIPVVTVPASFTIPKSTPFILTGSATDADGDPLTYSWEEVDNNNTGGNWNDGQKPYFRSNNPISSPSRMFPKLSVVLSGTYTITIGEFLPTTAQTLNFRMVARDNRMGGGGVCYSSSNTVVNINSTAGPFAITYPNTTGITWASSSSQTVTWNVNSTNIAPISCTNVNILISYNGGTTFSTLINNVSNNGSHLITVPTLSTTISTCRIKVEAIGNIFFDINNNNFTITAGAAGINTIATTNMSMQVFPNPANEQIQINLSGLSKSEKSSLLIYDMLGKILIRDNLIGKENYELSYDISQFSKGIYIVEVLCTNKKAVSRLVKQ